MMNQKFKHYGLFIDITVIVLEIFGIVNEISRGFQISSLMYYTTLSNYFALAACLLSMIYNLRELRTGFAVPKWVHEIKYMALIGLCITFIVVVFVLGPMMGGIQGVFFMLWQNDWKYRHFLCPVLMLIDNLFFEKSSVLSKHASFFAVLPTLIYAVTAIIMNLLYVWDGPYPFLRVYEQSLGVSLFWFIAILGIAYLLSVLLKKLRFR